MSMNDLATTIPAEVSAPAPAAVPLEVPPNDALAEQWAKKIERARKKWKKFHERVRHNRKTVSGFDWSKDPDAEDFYKLRANLIHGTITAVLPSIYARNPEISVAPLYKAPQLKLFCKTLEAVTNRHLELAGLKHKAKMSVRSALTCSFGVVKVMYQRDLQQDPVILSRMNDTQDNIAKVEHLMAEIEDPSMMGEHEAKLAELRETMAALQEQVEVVAAEGLVLDRVLTDHLLVDDTVREFWDYKDAGWIGQVIPMRRADAEATYKVKLTQAKVYSEKGDTSSSDGRIASAASECGGDDDQIVILEIWDKTSQRIYTMADGCKFWLREPYSPPRAGERWYPFFLLPFQLVDGEFVGPSLVDLTEKLQAEHNEARDRFNKHRDLAIPGWVAGGDVSQKSLGNFIKSTSVEGFGEVAIVDTEGKPLSQVIQPKQHPAIDPAVYDTSQVRYDWEQVTGMQDAARSTVVQPKTATEASIMQQALSGRVSEFRDQVEDWLQEISKYAAEILLFELTPAQVERIMGPHGEQVMDTPMGQITVPVPTYDWPELTRDQVFDMVELRIRAGTTGAPDKLEQQESWGKLLPVVQGLTQQIMQVQAAGGDAEPLIALLRETIQRFDDKLEVDQFIPKMPVAPAMPGMPAGGAGIPMPEGAPVPVDNLPTN